jgi:hypothetical protein
MCKIHSGIWITFLRSSSSKISKICSGKCWEIFQLGNDRFLPKPFQFIIHPSSYNRCCMNGKLFELTRTSYLVEK